MSPNVRFGFFVAVAAFFVLGPIRTEVLLGPGRTSTHPWRPMNWHAYQGMGVGYCQAQVHAMRDGRRAEYAPADLVKAVGRGSAKTRRRAERSAVGKKARENDIIYANDAELADTVKVLCQVDPDVRAEMRCAPAYPGGKWRLVEDGASNLCERATWPITTTPSSGPQPNLDPETGEEIDPEPPE